MPWSGANCPCVYLPSSSFSSARHTRGRRRRRRLLRRLRLRPPCAARATRWSPGFACHSRPRPCREVSACSSSLVLLRRSTFRARRPWGARRRRLQLLVRQRRRRGAASPWALARSRSSCSTAPGSGAWTRPSTRLMEERGARVRCLERVRVVAMARAPTRRASWWF